MRRGCLFAALLTTALLAGCATYRPVPLTQQGVAEKLAPPDPNAIAVQAESIAHPILKPVHFDVSDGLSPDEAAILAVLANPGLRVERDRRNTVCAQLLQARLLPNPQFTYTPEFPTGGLHPNTVNAFGFGLNWDVSELISHGAKVEAASLQPKKVVLDIAWKEWEVAESAKMAVYRKLSLVRETALAHEMDQRLQENLAVIREAMQKGLTTELVLAAAETASNQAHANLLELQKQSDEQSVALNFILGLPAETQVVIEEKTVLPDHLEPAPATELLADLEQRRLDLVALRYGYRSQEATVRAAILDQFPKFNLGMTYSRDNTGVLAPGFGIAVGIPIFDHNQGHIAEERATRQTLFDEYVNRVFESRSNVVKYLTQIRWLNAQIKTAQDAVPELQRLVDTYRVAVNAGQADVLSYYTAWNDLTQKRIEILKFQQQLVEARISLELETGLYQLPCVTGDATTRNDPAPSTSEHWSAAMTVRRWISPMLVLAVLAAIFAASGVGYWYGTRSMKMTEAANQLPSVPEGPPHAKVRLVRLTRQHMEETLTAYGSVVAALGETRVVSEPFESRVVKVLVRPGQTIASADPLIEIEPSPDTLLQLNEARDNRDTAASELKLVQERLQLKLATRADLLQAQQQYQTAELRLKSLQKRGIDGAKTIRTEAKGMVSRVDVQEGQIVAAGAPFLAIIGQNQINVRLGIENEDLSNLRVGQPVRLVPVNATKSETVTGHIHLITWEVNPQTRLADVFVIPPPDARLLLDDYIEGKIQVAAEDVLALPRAAVLPKEGRYVIYTVEKGHAKEHVVEVGMENDKQVQVIGSSLREGQEVVVEGNAELEDGMAIQVESGP